MNNKANNLIFKLFDDVKRFQNNIDESLAITLGLVYLIYADKESFISGSETDHKDNDTYSDDVYDFIWIISAIEWNFISSMNNLKDF